MVTSPGAQSGSLHPGADDHRLVEGDKGAVEAGDLEDAGGAGGPGGREHGGQLGGIETCGGAAGGGEFGVVSEATDLKVVDGLKAGDRVEGGSGGQVKP